MGNLINIWFSVFCNRPSRFDSADLILKRFDFARWHPVPLPFVGTRAVSLYPQRRREGATALVAPLRVPSRSLWALWLSRPRRPRGLRWLGTSIPSLAGLPFSIALALGRGWQGAAAPAGRPGSGGDECSASYGLRPPARGDGAPGEGGPGRSAESGLKQARRIICF